ncbi:protein of unknown function [Moritella yayanosii]|uniref:Uncharacterized protein n=1 Tax=Moritella yayanosii TaxID=69539 RepID=A0A330LNR5_9GAMM|nr:protein of unknown function [Moritella yayanosii]
MPVMQLKKFNQCYHVSLMPNSIAKASLGLKMWLQISVFVRNLNDKASVKI